LGCQVEHATEGAVNVTLEVSVVEGFEQFATPADYLAAAGELETFEWVKEGHKSVPVEEDATNHGKEFGAILGATIACDDVAFERNTRVGRVKDAVTMGICFTREADEVANVCFAAPGIFHVVDACLARDRNAQGIHQRGGCGGELLVPAKLDLFRESLVS